MGLITNNESTITPTKDLLVLLDQAEKSGSLKPLELLPGPWSETSTPEEKVHLVQRIQLASCQGCDIHLFAEWQQQYGDQGLATNIVVPAISPIKYGTSIQIRLIPRVIVTHPDDSQRIACTHVRKEGNFEPLLLDSVISTTDNENWQEQRRSLMEAFLPLSTLGEILPVSLARAKSCAKRLAELCRSGQEVDMSDFLLHEAQAQLQMALMGASEDFMEGTNSAVRAAFSGNPNIGKVGDLAACMKGLMERAQSDKTFAVPSDQCPVKGPLSRVVATTDLTSTAAYGNLLLILFAGHDTTGHTMTWLLFELSRNPAVQLELQAEVDRFFRELDGRDPTYRDLSKLELMDRCITETLRLWPAVPNGTFRQLQFDDTITGPGGEDVKLPRGTALNIQTWSRHRNKALWGDDADRFNPRRNFVGSELARVACPMAGANPSSDRFSPFAHSPRSCLGRNFAQMEMRLIMLYLFRDFNFALGPTNKRLMNRTLSATATVEEFRGINRGTMGPMNLEESTQHSWGTRPLVGMKLLPQFRSADGTRLAAHSRM